MHSHIPFMRYSKNSNSSLACNSKILREPHKFRSKLLNGLEYLPQIGEAENWGSSACSREGSRESYRCV